MGAKNKHGIMSPPLLMCNNHIKRRGNWNALSMCWQSMYVNILSFFLCCKVDRCQVLDDKSSLHLYIQTLIEYQGFDVKVLYIYIRRSKNVKIYDVKLLFSSSF